ncbi:MAG: PD40 domain-containing protein [Acidobacteria bacterium]|nr:PD40 domain-containing protein [Acidobacteriota bacterium]
MNLSGKRVLVTLIRRDGRNQAVLLSTADGSTELVREFVGLRTPLRMKFSPDGRYIAYDFPAGGDSHDWDVFVMSAEGRNSAWMVQHRGNDLLIGWAPDGKSLVFESDRAGNAGVWLQPASDGKPAGGAKLVKGRLGPRFFPVGITRQGSLFYIVESEVMELFVAEWDSQSGESSSSPKLLGQIGYSSAYWSPDGTKLVYAGRFGPLGTGYTAYSLALVIRDWKSGAERKVPIALSGVGAFQPRWSPDGRWLLASGSDARGLHGVYRIDPETGKVTPVVQQNGRGDSRMFTLRSAVWSADGKAIFYRRTSGGRVSILARRFDTEEEKELVGAELPASILGSLAVSPDGRWLAFVSGSEPGGLSALQIMPAGGGSARELLTLRSPDTITQLAWMPDGNSIIFGKGIRTGERERFELWRISREGGSPKSLGIAMDGRTLFGLSIHPDGNRVAFAAEQPYRSELWVLNDFLGQQPRTAN